MGILFFTQSRVIKRRRRFLVSSKIIGLNILENLPDWIRPLETKIKNITLDEIYHLYSISELFYSKKYILLNKTYNFIYQLHGMFIQVLNNKTLGLISSICLVRKGRYLLISSSLLNLRG